MLRNLNEKLGAIFDLEASSVEGQSLQQKDEKLQRKKNEKRKKKEIIMKSLKK